MPAAPVQTEILIVGGGLAGCAAAVMLARAGREVTLVEREQVSRHKVCGEFLSTEALKLLWQLGIDPAEHGGVPIHTVRLAAKGSVTEAALPFLARSLTRRCLDGLLLNAAEQAGARVIRGATVEGLTTSGSHWQAALQTGETLAASRALLATGKHDLRGFPRPHGLQGDLVALKMYMRLSPEQASALQGSVELLLHPQGYTGLEPVEGGAANLTGLVRRQYLAELGGWTGLLADMRKTNRHAAVRLDGAEPLLEKPLAIASIPYGFVRKEALAANLWAVGDQAAVIPSFTGDGMSIALYTGLRAAQGLLRGEPASEFQHGVHRALRWQVLRATALSRALVHPVTSRVLTVGAGFWPAGLRAAAALTRIPEQALAGLGVPVQGWFGGGRPAERKHLR